MGILPRRHRRSIPWRRSGALGACMTASLCSLAFGPGVAAQTRETRPLEEVIVTAQKRAERLQDVPIAISVLDGASLDNATVEGVAAALNRVPGVTTVTGSFFGGTQVTVRGITAAGPVASGASPVSYYLDSAPFGLVKTAIVPDANAYDLDRVEVLRGPQGTLYGAGGVGGVVRILTKDANPDAFEIKARTSGSSTKDGGENYRGDMAVNVPIVAGKLAARAVVGYEDWGGWIDRPNREDANEGDVQNFRLKVNARPTDALSIGLSGWLSRSDFRALPLATAERANRSRREEPVEIDYEVYGLNVHYDFPGVALSSASSYLHYTNDSQADYEALFGLTNTILYTGYDSKVVSQEVNLSSTAEGPWVWTFGGIYRDGLDHFYQFRQQYANPLGNRFTDGSQSFAVFGELTRSFADGKFALTGGLRYFEDEVAMEEISRITGLPPGAQPISLKRNFDATTPRVVLAWHASEQVMAYASYSEGFRSGWDDGPATKINAPFLPPVEPDELKNYEVGLKGTLFGGSLGFDTAIYYIDWEDIQQVIAILANSGTGSTLSISAGVNGETASGVGADLGLTGSPAAGLNLGLSVSWNQLELEKDVFSFPTPATSLLLFKKGQRLALSPEYTAALSADYTFPLGKGYEGRFAASGNYITGTETLALVNGVRTLFKGENMLTSQASFSVNAPERWVATLFVDNIGDEADSPYPTPTPGQFIRIRPRTVGLQLEYKFE